MGKLTPIMSSFAAGEITPKLHLNTTIQGYGNGLKYTRNWLTTSHGPVIRRGGFGYEDSIAGTSGKVYPFLYDESQGYIATMSQDGNLYVNDTAGNIIEDSDNVVTNGDFSSDGTGWTTAGTVVFGEGLCILTPADPTDASIVRQVTVVDPLVEHLVRIVVSSLSVNVRVRIGTTSGDNDIDEFVLTGHINNDRSFTPGSGNTSFYIMVVADADEDEIVASGVFCYELNATADIEFSHSFTASDIDNMQIGIPPGENAMYFLVGSAITKLLYSPDTASWSYAEVEWIEKPKVWTGSNYPRAIGFFQGRMILGGTKDQPEKFWGSGSATLEDFPEGGTNAADSWSFELAHKGAIRWIEGVKNLLIGTENREYIVTSEGGLIIPGDIDAEVQTGYGSARVQSAHIGNQVLYLSPDRRKIREMGFQWTDDGYVSKDLIFMSEHYTSKNDGIKQYVWVQNPNNHLWCVMDSGDLICATYDKQYNIIGWHKHETDGDVLSVCSLEQSGVSVLWALIDRGFGSLYLEKMNEDVYTDSFLEINNGSPSDAIALPHLANKTVSIIADGAVHPNVLLDGSGDGTLNYDADDVFVGLPYISTLTTLPLDATITTGAVKSSFKRWSNVMVSIINSYRPLINGVRRADRSPSTPMNEVEPPKTEYIPDVGNGYDNDATITIVQDLPVSCEINGIFGEVQYDTQ